MGSPKALLPYQGRPFLQHLLEVTRNPKIGVRRVVVGAHAGEIATAVNLPDDELVINPDWSRGQLTSIHAALRSLPAGTDGILLCLVDHPLISADLVNKLIAHFYESRAAIVVPVYQGRRGHPVIFSAQTYPELENAPAEVGARAVVWAHQKDVHEYITMEEGCVLNLNDPETFERIVRAKED